MQQPKEYIIRDNGTFPNSILPVLLYEQVIKVPLFFAAGNITKIFEANDWGNNWCSGIFTYNHYHSNTHEAMAVIKGSTRLLLGGENGMRIKIMKGDVLIIPAGVAHRNEGREKDVLCIGGYPGGKDYDMNYGNPEERPKVDQNIKRAIMPAAGPMDDQTVLPRSWQAGK